jgi:hypothetical protein
VSEGDEGTRRSALPASSDILDQGNGPLFRWWPTVRLRPPPAIAVILGVAGLLAGLASGYAAGTVSNRESHRSAHTSTAVNEAALSARGGAFPLAQSGPQCSAQTGTTLELGVQVTNVSPAPADLNGIRVVGLIGGLTVIGRAWGTCGEPPQASFGAAPTHIPPGASTWFTVTFQVLVACPKPFPVQFALGYTEQGRHASVRLPGFSDLSQVPYTGCP